MTVLRVKRVTLGVVAVLFWLVGAVLPIMPGWPFLLFAVFILSRDIPLIRPLREWLAAKHPKIADGIAHWEKRLGLLTPEELAAAEHHRLALRGEP
jgi:uncharacterized membrane protein YbaN (DUF454 family)